MSNIINIQNIEKYPTAYTYLNDESKNTILNYMNGMQQLANRYYEKYMNALPVVTKYLSLYQHTLTGLTGAKNAYATLGIMVEYNWPGHKDFWFLATREDTENYNNSEENEITEEVNTEINELIQYGDIQ